MSRYVLALVLCVFAAVGIAAVQQSDPIRAQIEAARVKHDSALADAKSGLLRAFDDEVNTLAQAGDLDGVKALQAERKAFEDEAVLPKAARLRPAVVEYRKATSQALATLSSVYDQAVKDLTKSLKIEEAETIREEWKQVQREAGVLVERAPAPAAAEIAFEYKFYEWKKGDAPVKMLRQEEGFCYLVGITGQMAGGGESVQITLENDGFWYLKGKSATREALNVRAVGVKVRRK